ncbi:50S ribosomal protein L22 [Halobacteriales archaeon SW_5_70_135]|nr:MAG: 50S ribosomal protein L22 [Halobacteriales archaeon SW_5_70_135]
MGISYSVDVDSEVTAKGMLRERHVSHKHSVAIAREIKGRTIGDARSYLEAVVDGEQAVPFRSHNGGVGHRSDVDGWDAGRYPEKASGAFLDLVENVANNAEHQGFEPETMEIVHVAAHKVGEIEGRTPRAFGRSSPSTTPEVDVELVAEADEPPAGGNDDE